MMYIRTLTQQGLDEFSNYIQEIRQGIIKSSPVDVLSKEPYSIEFNPSIKIENCRFATRMEMGKHLSGVLTGIERNRLLKEFGMWSWLVLFWFDQLCPPDANGIRKVRESARYICSMDYTDWYRHLVAAPWDIFSLHGEFSRLFLTDEIHKHNDFVEQLGARQNIISSKSIIEAADKLYWGTHKNTPKRNATNRKIAGNLRRFIMMTEQFGLTYDLYKMSADDILSLLPHEFDRWRKTECNEQE